MTTGWAPLAVVRAGVVTQLQSSPAARARYRAEWTAELHQLSASAQLVFLVGLLSRVLTLRTALTTRPDRAQEDAMASTEDGGRYEECRRCGVDRGPVGFGPLTTPPWSGSR